MICTKYFSVKDMIEGRNGVEVEYETPQHSSTQYRLNPNLFKSNYTDSTTQARVNMIPNDPTGSLDDIVKRDDGSTSKHTHERHPFLHKG